MKEFLDNYEYGWLIVSIIYLIFMVIVAYIVRIKIFEKRK